MTKQKYEKLIPAGKWGFKWACFSLIGFTTYLASIGALLTAPWLLWVLAGLGYLYILWYYITYWYKWIKNTNTLAKHKQGRRRYYFTRFIPFNRKAKHLYTAIIVDTTSSKGIEKAYAKRKYEKEKIERSMTILKSINIPFTPTKDLIDLKMDLLNDLNVDIAFKKDEVLHYQGQVQKEKREKEDVIKIYNNKEKELEQESLVPLQVEYKYKGLTFVETFKGKKKYKGKELETLLKGTAEYELFKVLGQLDTPRRVKYLEQRLGGR